MAIVRRSCAPHRRDDVRARVHRFARQPAAAHRPAYSAAVGRPCPSLDGTRRHTHFFRSRIVTRIDSRSAPTTTNAGQADRAGLAGGANATVTLKRRNAIRAKPPGLTSSGNPLQRARLSSRHGVASSGQPSLLEATPAELQAVAHLPVLQPTVLHSAPSHEGHLIDLSDPPTTTRPAGTPPSLLEATPDELQAVAHHPVLQPTVLHSAPSHEGHLIDLSDPPTTTRPAGTPPSLLEATPDELQAVAHHPVLQPTVPHSAHAQEGHLIDLSDAPPATPSANVQTAPLGAAHAPHGTHGTQHGSQAFAAAGMPSIQQIEHETRQMIGMQRAIGFQNQLLAAAEMLNSFRMKLLDMIKKAVSS
ncbi:hypothetical protein [Burkholderia ubonensis]|uniref:hypothetical protein n=1 Tax=Burkholderia ubonensis TaxID=101571 RepID=UPI001E49EC0C|nr:hypothetical protein [Burkholderia ubonensis]